IDSGTADRQRVYGFYNGLLDSATSLFDTQARVVPDVIATQGGIAATDTFRASDLMSRAGSIITGAFGSRTLSEHDYLEFVSLVALAVAVGAIVWAVRQSQVLVDRALSVRLAQLGRDAAAVVDKRLPEMMNRLRRREKIDPAVELPSPDYGSDEIGQLADVL